MAFYSEDEIRAALTDVFEGNAVEVAPELAEALGKLLNLANVGGDLSSAGAVLGLIFSTHFGPYEVIEIDRHGKRLGLQGKTYDSASQIADEWLEDQFGNGIAAISKHIDLEALGEELMNDLPGDYYGTGHGIYYFDPEP